MSAIRKWSWTRSGGRFVAGTLACLFLSFLAPIPLVDAAQTPFVKFTAADLATANGSARIGGKSGNLYCVLTSIETRVQLDPDRWGSDEEATNWTTWLTAFDDNLYAKWLKNAPLNAQETVGIRINPDSSVNITNNTFLSAPDIEAPNAQSTFEAAIAASLNETLKMAKPMPVTKNKLKEVHMSLTFMREPRALPRYGKNDYGFLAVAGDKPAQEKPGSDKPADEKPGDKGFISVYERTTPDGRFPGIQILSDDGQVVPLEQPQFNQKVAEKESDLAPAATTPVPAATPAPAATPEPAITPAAAPPAVTPEPAATPSP